MTDQPNTTYVLNVTADKRSDETNKQIAQVIEWLERQSDPLPVGSKNALLASLAAAVTPAPR